MSALVLNNGLNGSTTVQADITSSTNWSISFPAANGTLLVSSGGALVVSQGGTGLTSPGTAGYVLTSNGTSWVSAPPPGGTSVVQTFNGRSGNVLLLSLDVTNALGYTPPTPTGTGASGTWPISISGGVPNLTGGAANQLLFQSAANTTAFATAPTTANTYLEWTGSGFAWATLSGTTGLTNNSIVFNNTGLGGASGLSFNGSAASTVSYNTIGAAAATGGNATGNWPINAVNITAYNINQSLGTTNTPSFYTVTAPTAPSTQSANFNTDFSVVPLGAYSYNGGSQTASSFSPGGVHWFQTNYRDPSAAALYGTQVCWGYEDNANSLATRDVNANVYGSWVYYLNSNNYTNYVPSKTGTGASGTWAINITGNAPTATTASGLTTTNNYQVNALGVNTAALGAGTITATGNIIAYYSDDRLKTRTGNIENALAKVESLTGFYYEANNTAQSLGYKVKPEVGLSAQDVDAVMPEVVYAAPIDPEYKTVDYPRLIPLLVEAIKELSAQVKELQAKV